jgi:hypothetical protein
MNDDLRCSAWTRSNGVDPIGTAGSYAGVLLVERPLPWPRDVAEIPELTDVAAAARRARVRLQAVIGTEPARGRVAFYRWQPEDGVFSGVEVFAGDRVAAAATEFLEGNPPAGARPVEGPEVLVCGHGRRDRCCGSLGTSLALTLEADASLRARVKLWRTSHTGGHRFAPTFILLPEGTAWGYLDPDSAKEILTRSQPVDEQLGRYRGCLGLASPAIQAIERAALKEVGWPLLEWFRVGEELGDGMVDLRATSKEGESRHWRARVVTRRVLPVPQCGAPISEELKTEPELAVEGLEELAPARR